MKKKLRAIFFDVDDTLFSTSEFAKKAHLNAVEAMVQLGLKMPVEELFLELREIISEFSSNYNHHFDKLLQRIDSNLYKNITPSILIAAAVVAYHNTKYTALHPFQDAQKLLEKLSEKNIIRGIITAGFSIKQSEKLIRLRLYQYFTSTAIFISDDLGISKPNPKLYQKACRTVGVSPKEAMHIGDHPLRDIDPANHIDMITVRVCKGGKYQNLQGKTTPNYQIDDFSQLWEILQQDFDLMEVK